MEAIPVSIEGRIAIDVNFTDTSTAGGASSVKKISLVDTQAYTSGKAVVVAGTVGTQQQSIYFTSISYVGAAGSAVTLTPSRIAISVVGSRVSVGDPLQSVYFLAPSGSASVLPVASTDDHVDLQTTAGTAVYTAVFYGT
jgi:hypothetical protein